MTGFENIFSPSWRFIDTFLDLQLSAIGDGWTGWDCIALDFLQAGVNIMFAWGELFFICTDTDTTLHVICRTTCIWMFNA